MLSWSDADANGISEATVMYERERERERERLECRSYSS